MRWWFTYWSRHGVPGPNFMEYDLFYNIHHDYILNAVQKYGRIYGTYIGTSRSLVVNEPDLLRDIMVRDFHVFPDHRHFDPGSTKVSKLMYFMPGDDDWKRVRSIVSAAFTLGKVRAMMAHIDHICDTFVDNLDAHRRKEIALQLDLGEPVNMRLYFGAFLMDVISACAYGINPESINNLDHPIVTNAKRILSVDGFRMLFLVLAPWLAKLLKLQLFDTNSIDYFDELTKQIFKERKAISEHPAKRRIDFIQLMIDSENTDKDLDYNTHSDGEQDVESTDAPTKGLRVVR
ncbi:unnamed protein product [Oppiella nova]|uniref:Cytochrome P450 n=1 Tax=Oppiella nova TaxID=334625 RepID=A0A7R9MLG0_9ACAR|nr:unnamed protein product [Oppiella nova]CAG2178374.1 unnamed protein product [Oppiella nova]